VARPYRGRFAPSPNGLLHQGSLLAAVASWLDARAHDGTWLIRMEDLDAPRVVPGAAEAMLATLAAFGMESDAAVLWQSTRTPAYREALAALIQSGLAYRCRCTRGERMGPGPCPCRDLALDGTDCAWRLRIGDAVIAFDDGVQGRCEFAIDALGDPILFRRDGLAAYQLAVVVDDAFQQITDVVRGADLLESTAWQIAIFRALRLEVPRFSHIPLLTEADGGKLAKSRRSLPLEKLEPRRALHDCLAILGIALPAHLKAAPVSDMLHWSVQHWQPLRMSGIRNVAMPD
jgi:glutamyl-Q tRNA(Asp) synthetase